MTQQNTQRGFICQIECILCDDIIITTNKNVLIFFFYMYNNNLYRIWTFNELPKAEPVLRGYTHNKDGKNPVKPL